MPIVQQSAPALFTSPPIYLPSAPPKRLALPAPKIVGLLPASIETRKRGRLAGGDIEPSRHHDYRIQVGVHAPLPNQKRRKGKKSSILLPEMADTLENLVLNCPNFDDVIEAIGPIRPAAELEAEFAAIQARIETRFQQLYDHLTARSARTFHSSRSTRDWFAAWEREEAE